MIEILNTQVTSCISYQTYVLANSSKTLMPRHMRNSIITQILSQKFHEHILRYTSIPLCVCVLEDCVGVDYRQARERESSEILVYFFQNIKLDLICEGGVIPSSTPPH